MPLVDRCIFQAVAGGLGDFVVFHAVAGYLTPAQAGAVDQTLYPYAAEVRDTGNNITAWETGHGKWVSASSTLQRGTVEFSSAANAKVSFLAAPVVAFTLLAADLAPALTQWGSVATAAAGFIPAGVNSLATAGYATAGDGGAATYVRASGSTLGGFQSADGQWWQLSAPGNEVNVMQFGAKGDGVQDDTDYIPHAIDFFSPKFSPATAPPFSRPKVVRFPTPSAFCRIGHMVEPSTRYPETTVGAPFGYPDSVYFVGLKNITFRGDVGKDNDRPRIVHDAALQITNNKMWSQS